MYNINIFQDKIMDRVFDILTGRGIHLELQWNGDVILEITLEDKGKQGLAIDLLRKSKMAQSFSVAGVTSGDGGPNILVQFDNIG